MQLWQVCRDAHEFATERTIALVNGYLEELASALYKKFAASADGRMGTLADLVELQKDSARVGKHPELPYMPIDVMPIKHIGVTEFKANEEAKSSLQLFRRDDIVIGAMRVYFHRVVLAPCEGITRNTCFVLRPRSSSLREYALLTCFQPEAIEYANVRSKGSTMPYAVWENSFETYPVLIPEERQLDRFSKQLAPLIDWIQDSYRENNKLASLRDALLPKLMSGEIDVSKINLTQLNSHLAEESIDDILWSVYQPHLPFNFSAYLTGGKFLVCRREGVLGCEQLLPVFLFMHIGACLF